MRKYFTVLLFSFLSQSNLFAFEVHTALREVQSALVEYATIRAENLLESPNNFTVTSEEISLSRGKFAENIFGRYVGVYRSTFYDDKDGSSVDVGCYLEANVFKDVLKKRDVSREIILGEVDFELNGVLVPGQMIASYEVECDIEHNKWHQLRVT